MTKRSKTKKLPAVKTPGEPALSKAVNAIIRKKRREIVKLEKQRDLMLRLAGA